MKASSARQRFIYVCNVFESKTLALRGVSTYSPAASGKVIRICQALRRESVDAWIVSLGRRRQNSSGRVYSGRAVRDGATPLLYLLFCDLPILTHLVSAFSLCMALWRLRRERATIVFYNHLPHYVPGLVVARIFLRATCVLDLEDGYSADEVWHRRLINRSLLRIYNFLCGDVALVANSRLREQVSARRAVICYGVAPAVRVPDRPWSGNIQVLFSGALMKETGVAQFLGALEILSTRHPEVFQRFRFVVTGFGEGAEDIRAAAAERYPGILDYRGMVRWADYRSLLEQSHVGLCLKIPGYSLADTTFPSKVVEMAAYGLLVTSNRVSDVPLVLPDDCAFLLESADAESLAAALVQIARDPERAAETAARGQRRITSRMSPESVAADLKTLWA